MKRILLLLGTGSVAALAAYAVLRTTPIDEPPISTTVDGQAMVSIQLPALEGNAAIGQRIFEASCAACHGVNAVGKEGTAPPLIHKIYEPSHHADESFQRAVAMGVKAHHWRFGDMPAVDGLTRGDVAMVINYIRTIQRANGIN